MRVERTQASECTLAVALPLHGVANETLERG